MRKISLVKTWERHFFSTILQTFFLVFFSFFILYVFIDYSMHLDEMVRMKRPRMIDFTLYYGMLFAKRGDLLLPLILLITTIKVLVSLSQNYELIALQASGIPLFRLTLPFFFVGLFCVALSYANFEIFIPQSLKYIDRFEKHHFKTKRNHKEDIPSIQGALLEDGSHLLYQTYDSKQNVLLDCFWILSMNELYHIKTLSLTDQKPIGTFVDHLRRSETGKIAKVACHPRLEFYNLKICKSIQNPSKTLIKNLSIKRLIQMALRQGPFLHENQSSIQAHLYFKLLMPWLSILVLIHVIPPSISSIRSLSIFLTFCTALFCYITLFTLMNGCLILAEGGVIAPFWGIVTLPLVFCTIFGIRFVNRCLRPIK